MIVGTAGHIDHGKTTLVKALTGVDTDRLPEEKKRGISIELGYAFMDAPGGERIGFIDVPGHERLVHTMLAGATGIDFALLLVAADDGPMPQTREHLAVLSLLGLQRGAVVVTKADRVDAARLQSACDEAAALRQGTPLHDAPVLAVSAATGAGIEGLRALLEKAANSAADSAAAATPPRAREGVAFRLAIDRAFALDGVGTVLTGTTHAGQVAVGDELVWVPGGLGQRERVRVRSVHAGNRAVDHAVAGQRCALGVVGIERESVARGDWLVAPEAALATDRFDASLSLWQGEAKPLRSGTPVFAHLGAAAVQGTLALLDAEALEPGQTARVQLVLRRKIGAWAGDRIVLRDAAATRTLAGGRVLDPFAPTRYRRTPQRLAELDALALPDTARRAQALVAVAPLGVDLARLRAAAGCQIELSDQGLLRAAGWVLGPAQADAARAAVLQALTAYHGRSPDALGPDAGRLRRLAMPRLGEPLWRALLQAMIDAGELAQRGAFVHLPAHGIKLSAVDERIAQKIAVPLQRCGFEGAWARDLARDSGESEPLMRVTLARLAQRGEVHQVVRDLAYPAPTMQRLGQLARQVAAQNGGEVTAAKFRDATQLGRKRAIQILEYLDRIGMLRRVGDVHRLRSDSALFMEEKSGG